MRKKYNTPHRRHVVKTRLSDEEYADFTGRLAAYEISQSEFIRQAIRGATIRPVITVSPVNDGLLTALSKLTAEYGKIGGKRAEGKGRGYEKWATMHNLKQMSATLMLYQQYGFSSPDELDAAISAANAATQESLAGLKGLEAAIREKKELQRNLLGYIGTKPARDGLKAQKSEKARRAYREQHESDFIIADTAARYFREHGITKLPASKALQREIEQLTVQKNAGYNDYREKRQRAQELQTVRRNIDQILRGAPSQQKKREQER